MGANVSARLPWNKATFLDIYESCWKTRKNKSLRQRCREDEGLIIDANERLESSSAHDFPLDAELFGAKGSLSKDELIELYDKGLMKLSGAKRYAIAIKKGASGRCSYCGRSLPTLDLSLDHFFPKSVYPLLSVSPTNLIPSCRDCNEGQKRDQTFEKYTEMPYNPYFEENQIARWLLAEIGVDDCRPYVAYSIRPLNPEDNEADRSRAQNYFELFNLGERYSLTATDEIQARQSEYVNCYKLLGCAQFFRIRKAEYESCLKGASMEYWRPAFEHALMTSEKYHSFLEKEAKRGGAAE